MHFLRLVEKVLIRLLLIIIAIPLQSCSNTQIGEKLENSFDIIENISISGDKTKVKVEKKLRETKKIKSSKKDDEEENKNESKNDKVKIVKENVLSNKDRFSQKSTKLMEKVIFNPHPYRIILKLSGANPSAPAETVTKALRKAGIQFEVEKIERFDEERLLRDSSLNRK